MSQSDPKSDFVEAMSEMALRVFAEDSVKAKCISCGIFDTLIPIEDELDEIFLANYLCDDCEAKEN